MPTITTACRRPRSHRCWAGLAVVFASLLTGCQNNTEVALRRQVVALEAELAAQQQTQIEQQTTIDELNRQLADARAFSAEDLQFIYYPEQIRFASMTGGADFDEQPGDDGVIVYLQPVDRDGDIVKVAGAIRIELFDLALAPGQTLIGRYEFPAAETRELWYGSLWTEHYTLKCPWRGDPPQHREITIRAVFTDYLTQRVMTAQTVVKVNKPSDTAT